MVSLKSSVFVVPQHGFHERTGQRVRGGIHKKDKIEIECVMVSQHNGTSQIGQALHNPKWSRGRCGNIEGPKHHNERANTRPNRDSEFHASSSFFTLQSSHRIPETPNWPTIRRSKCYRQIMPFEPDIYVTGSVNSEIVLVVDVKTNLSDFEATERELKKFMAGTRCPAGALITPQKLWLYRDRYLPSQDSVQNVGAFDISKILNFIPSGVGQRDEFAFENLVQSWLESLRTEAGLRRLPRELRNAVELFLMPSIFEGEIGAAHPRSLLNS
jgi:hypothetical protein